MDNNIKKLYRSKTDKMIAGVCGGIAKYFGIDSTLVRIIYAIVAIFTAIVPCLIIYLVLWILIPEEPVP